MNKAETEMKNVILLTIDTLRKDALGSDGSRDNAPFINSLQEKCLRFTNMQAIGPYTQASFPGILTSSYYLEYGREKKLSLKRTLISEVLKKYGITTAAFHSNPYLSAYFGWNRGWDVFYDSMEAEVNNEVPFLTGNEINKKVGEWLSSYIKGGKYRSFFLWLHYMDVHEPYMPKKEYIDLVDSSIHLSREEMFHLFKDILLKRDLSDKGKVELLMKFYLARVREVDAHIKDFYNKLERLGLLENSIIILTSDHGDEFGEHGGLSHDGKMYRELINVPCLIYEHAREKLEISTALLSSVDIPPTIVRLFDFDPEGIFEGHSIFPLEDYPEKGCFGEAIDKRSAHEKETDKPIYYYQRGDLKIIYRESIDSWELYDLEKDPKELDNIVDSSSQAEEMKTGLRPRIKRWLRE